MEPERQYYHQRAEEDNTTHTVPQPPTEPSMPTVPQRPPLTQRRMLEIACSDANIISLLSDEELAVAEEAQERYRAEHGLPPINRPKKGKQDIDAICKEQTQ